MKMDNKQTLTDEFLLRCLEGTASDAEYEQAWHWVHRSRENKEYYGRMRDVWIASGLTNPVDKNVQNRVWLRINNKIGTSKTSVRKTGMIYLGWAGAAAVIAFAYFVGTRAPSMSEIPEAATSNYTIEAPKGGKSVITLSDGSKVWLNAGSTLLFDKAFGERNRTLSLYGEAYFEVARDAERPFLVEASGITIAALGTAFNVKAYPEEEMIETTLVEGSVRVETHTQSDTKTTPIILKPNQRAVFYKSRQTISVNPDDAHTSSEAGTSTRQRFSKIEVAENVDVEVSTSWKDKRWIVLGESLGEFAANIERKYDVVLVFEDAELEGYKISATLEEETIEQLLNAVKLTVPMNYRIERNRVFLTVNHRLKKEYDRLIRNNK